MGSIARRSSDDWTVTVTASSGPFERHLLARRGLWRDLRAGADHRRLPPRAARGQADLQRRPDRRRRDRRARRGPDPPGSHRQDQHHRRDRRRARRPARPQPRADRARPGEDAGDRRPAARRAPTREDRVRPRRLSADGADRRATARCWPGSTRSTATWAWPRWASSTRSSAAPATSASSPQDVDGLAGLGAASERRPCARRDGRHRVDLAPGQARGDPDEPVEQGNAVEAKVRFRPIAVKHGVELGLIPAMSSPTRHC